MRAEVLLSPFVVLALGCAGSRSGSETNPAEVQPAPVDAEPTMAQRIPGSRAAPRPEYAGHATAWSLDLHRALRQEGKNSVSSGPSAMVAFSMLGVAAKGGTLTELGAMFGAPHDEAWHIDNERALTAWNDTRGVKLATANAIWVDDGLTLAAPYVERVGASYGTAPSTLPFSANPTAAADTIDAWTNKNTLGMIQKLFAPDDLKGISVVLANTVAFQGSWLSRFDEEKTGPATFTTPTGEAEVPTMNQRLKARYTDGDGWTGLVLPYEGESTSMLLLLPDVGTTVEALEDKVELDLLSRLPEGPLLMVDVALPKFQFAIDHDLKAPIAALGAPSLFGGGDLSGLGLGQIGIDKAIQKVFVNVDEKGTEAAAVTAIAMKRSAGPPDDTMSFEADRPFLFVIWHHETGVPLFVGRVADPRG